LPTEDDAQRNPSPTPVFGVAAEVRVTEAAWPTASMVIGNPPFLGDTTFGILHSRFHERWSLRLGTSLEDRPRYTPTLCFEAFPFPAGLTPADTAYQRTQTLEGGAVSPVIRGQR
jgi:hypothetical protein